MWSVKAKAGVSLGRILIDDLKKEDKTLKKIF